MNVQSQSALEPDLPMNAPLLPEVLMGAHPVDQPPLPLATEGVQRYVWQSAYGPMLIEVHDGAAFVNGKRVRSMTELREPEQPA
jgi:hypothetical protein